MWSHVMQTYKQDQIIIQLLAILIPHRPTKY